MISTATLALDPTSDFSLRNAQSLALASQWAYNMPATGMGADTGAKFLLFDAGSAYVLTFPGTHDLRDWLTDCKFLLRSWLYGGKVHDGFDDAISELITDIAVQIKAAQSVTRKPLFICGHSLGGALAILAAHILWAKGFFIQAVYTYGQPRAGNRDFAAAYNSKLGAQTYRIAFEDDLVPHVPLPGLLFQYLQNKNEVFLRAHFSGIPNFQFNRPLGQKLVSDGMMLVQAWLLILACKNNPVACEVQLIDAVKKNHAIENYILHLNSIT